MKFSILFYKIGSRTVEFLSDLILASVWAQTGFLLWKSVEWFQALGIWIIYLVPVFLGFRIGKLIDSLDRELYFRAVAEVKPGGNSY